MNYPYVPHPDCGECIINLAWDDMSPADRTKYVRTHCSKCDCRKSISPDETCLGCGAYSPNGQLCWSCLRKVNKNNG